jgi:Protein of unknown function (DUF1091)
MDILIGSLSRYSNNTHECPFIPPEVFCLKNYTMSTDLLPPIMPAGDYRLDIEYLKDQNVTTRYAMVQVFINVRGLNHNVDLGMG